MNLHEALGNTDIYLLDQILRGTIPAGAKILDAGCGRGRNLHYFATNGFEVFASDRDAGAVQATRAAVEAQGIATDAEHFRVEPIEELSFRDQSFGMVICNAVLHFAHDTAHFKAMVEQLNRVLEPGGLCFCRLTSNIGIESLVEPMDPTAPMPSWHHLPDGSDRYLVDIPTLLQTTAALGAQLTDPIKTVNVQNMRCMTNWVWRKSAG